MSKIIVRIASIFFLLICLMNAIAQPQSSFNLDVQLLGRSKSTGYIIFRQDSDTSKIVTLETTVGALKPLALNVWVTPMMRREMQ